MPSTPLSSPNTASSVRLYEAVPTEEIFIFSAPLGYRYCVNLGYNETEAVYYANTRWLENGLHGNEMPSRNHIQNS